MEPKQLQAHIAFIGISISGNSIGEAWNKVLDNPYKYIFRARIGIVGAVNVLNTLRNWVDDQ